MDESFVARASRRRGLKGKNLARPKECDDHGVVKNTRLYRWIPLAVCMVLAVLALPALLLLAKSGENSGVGAGASTDAIMHVVYGEPYSVYFYGYDDICTFLSMTPESEEMTAHLENSGLTAMGLWERDDIRSVQEMLKMIPFPNLDGREAEYVHIAKQQMDQVEVSIGDMIIRISKHPAKIQLPEQVQRVSESPAVWLCEQTERQEGGYLFCFCMYPDMHPVDVSLTAENLESAVVQVSALKFRYLHVKGIDLDQAAEDIKNADVVIMDYVSPEQEEYMTGQKFYMAERLYADTVWKPWMSLNYTTGQFSLGRSISISYALSGTIAVDGSRVTATDRNTGCTLVFELANTGELVLVENKETPVDWLQLGDRFVLDGTTAEAQAPRGGYYELEVDDADAAGAPAIQLNPDSFYFVASWSPADSFCLRGETTVSGGKLTAKTQSGSYVFAVVDEETLVLIDDGGIKWWMQTGDRFRWVGNIPYIP